MFAFNDTPQVLNLSSEWLCWCMLWAGIKVYSFFSRKKIHHVQGDNIEEESTSLAFFIITSSVCASIVEVNWILPFLTPALYFVSGNNYVDNHVLPSSSKSERSKYPENYGYHMIFYILVAVSTSVLFLPPSSSPATIGLCLIFLICQTAIYWRLSLSQTADTEFQSPCQFFLNLEGTCCWVVCFLTIILLASQQEPPEILSVSIYSIFKALLWVAVIFLCKEGHACSLTLMCTFGLCTLYIHVITSLALAMLSCLCALLILAQIMSTLPRKCSTRLAIALFAAFPVVTLIFRFGTRETTEAFSDLMHGPFLQASCATNQDIVRNTIDIAQAVMDEPSRLVAEFGPRKDPKSWLDAILVFSKSCTDSNPVTVELR